MKKSKHFASLIIIIAVFTISAFATPKLFTEHKDRLKNGTKVVKTCNYCHNTTTKLEQKGGQDIKKFQKTKTCSGKECH